jgi:hypothetical protein
LGILIASPRYTWLFCHKFDAENQNAPALPFDETTVGAFIDNNSKQEDMNKSGLAHLKPIQLASGRISQVRGTSSKATTPVWARRPETTSKASGKPLPRRGIALSAGQALVGAPTVQRTPALQDGVGRNFASVSSLSNPVGPQFDRSLQLPRVTPRQPMIPTNHQLVTPEGVPRRREDSVYPPPTATIPMNIAPTPIGGIAMTDYTTLPLANPTLQTQPNRHPLALQHRPFSPAQYHLVESSAILPNNIHPFE